MKIYKFRNVDTYSLTGLANNTLWFSNLNDFNDPFEGSFILDDELSDSTIQELMGRVDLKDIDDVCEKRKHVFDELGIIDNGANKKELLIKILKRDFKKSLIGTVHKSKGICFSRHDPEPQKDPLLENLMWSHYANGLRGFCMVFDSEVFSQFHLAEKLSIRPVIIKYNNEPVTVYLEDYVHSSHVLGNNSDNMLQNVVETIATKSPSWKYEQEFRLISLEDSSLQKYPPESLLKIVIGDKMPKDQQKLVIETVKAASPTVKVERAKLKENSYKLELAEY